MESSSGIAKAKDFAPKNDVVDCDVEVHEDDGDELLDFEPVETAFEKSMTTARKNRKGRGVFGQRGRFGGSAVRRAFTTIGSNRRTNKARGGKQRGGRQRLDSDQESGDLGDDSSPEFARSRSQSSFSLLKEEDDDDDDSNNDDDDDSQSVPRTELFSNNLFGSGDGERIQRSAASFSQHARSSSMDYRPPQTKPPARRALLRANSMSVSVSSSSNSNSSNNPFQTSGATQNPIRRTFQRSHSLALGSTTTATATSSSTNSASSGGFNNGFQSSQSLSWSAMKGDYWGENADPNSSNINNDDTNNNDDLDAVERCTAEPGRKKMRARRHSCLGTAPLNRESSASSSAGSSMASFPAELGWLNPEASPSKTIGSNAFLEESANALSVFSSQSPSALSVASSSRKRGVCGSPISDAGIDRDDWCLTLSGSSYCSDARRTSRSRSRIFSASELSLPIAPLLAPDLFSDQQQEQKQPSSHHGRRKNRGDDTMEDDSSDDESQHHSSPDSSFEVMVTEKTNDDGDDQKPAAADDPRQAIFDTMSSFEDLKYLVRELQKEDQRHTTTFGMGDMWKVAPPMRWSGQRRSDFNGWTKGHLGFQVRSAGQGYTFLQIRKDRGNQVLESLEEALTEYQKMEQEAPKQQQQQQSEEEEEQHGEKEPSPLGGQLLFSSNSATKPFAAPSPSPVVADRPPMSIVKPDFCSSPEDVIMDDCEEDLVGKISSLSMNEPPQSSAPSSLARMVTLPQDEAVRQQQDARLSMESRVSRPSVEAATDVNFNAIFGTSPRRALGRPPKMSINSVGSFEAIAGGPAAPPARRSASPFTENATSASCNTSLLVATPLMNLRRDWGSRPIEGRDWGGSAVYDKYLMAELIQRFEEACRGDDPAEAETGLHDPFEDIPSRSCGRLFDHLEIEGADTFDEFDEALVAQRKEAERKTRRRQSSINKQRRMSIFAAAAGAKPRHPRESRSSAFQNEPIVEEEEIEPVDAAEIIGRSEPFMANIFSFMTEKDLMTKLSTVNTQWADWATDAHANLLLSSVPNRVNDEDSEECIIVDTKQQEPMLERTWKSLHAQFPWACYLAEGGAKTVYRAYNSAVDREEAISVMDTYAIESSQIVANELAVSAMLSSLVRRAVCPNYIVMRGVFTMANPPATSHWGDEDEKQPKGDRFAPGKRIRAPKTPKNGDPGRFQYIRMELVNEGDAEELIKRQKDEALDFNVARGLLFQIAFGLFAAADKYSVKHYDVKLLNIFVQRELEAKNGLVLRYGLGSHTFAVKMPASHPFVAKVADFGTANTVPDSNGQPVTMAHFTTLENTPPDFMILGDDATQGHEHDNFGMGLGMLHLFAGSRPYEEIMEDVKCPPHLKARLRKIWEDESVGGYSVIRTVISDDLHGTMYDTLYRFLVLFGIPQVKFQQKTCPKVWTAISESLEPSNSTKSIGGRGARKNIDSDVTQYNRDCKKFSIRTGNNKFLARARRKLNQVEGGMDLLLNLCAFDPRSRATAMNVLNSPFMEDLREAPGTEYKEGELVRSYTSFATHN